MRLWYAVAFVGLIACSSNPPAGAPGDSSVDVRSPPALLADAASGAPSSATFADAYIAAYDADEAVAINAIQTLGGDPSPRAHAVLMDIIRTSKATTPVWNASARSLMDVAEAALARGDRETAASTGLNIFLSSSPVNARERALAVYVRGAGDESLTRVEHVLEGWQDRQFADLARGLLQELDTDAALELLARFPAQ